MTRRRLATGAIDQVKILQGEALIAGLRLGARGPSVVMAAALGVLRELSPSMRIVAIRGYT